MIRILVYIALIFAAAAGFAWLADRPGEVALVWQGYEVRTSLMVGAVVVAAAFVLLAILLSAFFSILRAPRLFGGWMSGRKRDRGYRALSRGMIAIGAGDVKRAKRYAIESRKILHDEPLTLLLAAQAAQLTGDGAGARTAFETMLTEPETRLLGLRGLYVEAERAGEHEAARHYAEQAAGAAPTLAWAGTALFHYQASASDWRGALLTLGSNLQAKLVDRASAHRLRAVLLTARGLELESSDPEEAKAAALEAVRLAPGLVPAATLVGRLLTRQGDIKRASKLLETSWKLDPHPDVAEAYVNVRPGDAAGDRLKRARKLQTLRPHSIESQYAVAKAAIDAREWPEARLALGLIDEAARTERFCLLMAEIEDGAEGDHGRVREWLSRAVRAPRDPVWTADGYVFQAWAPVSPISGRLDVFEWRIPTLAQPGDSRPALDLDWKSEPEPPEKPALEASPLPEKPTAGSRAATPPVAVRQNGVDTLEPVSGPPLPDDPGIDEGTVSPVDRLRLQ